MTEDERKEKVWEEIAEFKRKMIELGFDAQIARDNYGQTLLYIGDID